MEYWEKIVRLYFHGPSMKALSVKSSKDAARLLLKDWPTTDGRSYRRAVLSCSAAVQGRAPQDLAQWAFIVAAMEAAMSYEIVDRFDSEIADVCRQLLAEEGALMQQIEAPPDRPPDIRQPFWWPKRSISVRSAR